MSNALALAHVTQALALLIESNLGPEFDEAVKVEPRKPPADPPADPTISVFLYQVTPNTSQRNNDLPTRAADGTLVKRPAAALDLHFLISAYGDETELVGHRLIGSVIRTLHEIPILPKDVIEQAGERPYLAGSDLAEAAQRVRFVPTVMDVDETSKLWGMLYQTPYSLSVVYQAALVLIDGRETPVRAKPVERSTVRVLPFGAPGAPVPPGAEPKDDVPPSDVSGADVVATTEAEEPGRTGVKKAAQAPVKAVAKTVAKSVPKAPARTRKSARAGKSAQPEPRKTAPRPPDGEGTED